MKDISTTYLGLKLKNPFIVSSSGLTNSVSKIYKLAAAGAGAVVLKSLFEEQINQNINNQIYKSEGTEYPEAYDYVAGYVKNNEINDYLELISEAKKKVDIPVIASINCFSSDEWVEFAKQIEHAGADAIELNLFVVNTDKNSNASEYEELYLKVLENVSKHIHIPIAMKLGANFSNLVAVVNKLSVHGAKGVVLFNRFYEPDIDINQLAISTSEVFSTPGDIRQSIRWVSIISSKVKNIDIAASTGIHTGEAAIKQLLVGAKAVQICSAIYKQGPSVITQMNNELIQWMTQKGFNKIDDFRGMLSYGSIQEPHIFERAQFMKYFSGQE